MFTIVGRALELEELELRLKIDARLDAELVLLTDLEGLLLPQLLLLLQLPATRTEELELELELVE